MSERRSANPFVPGRGGLPPYLAGRSGEQGKLLELLDYLKAGQGAPREAVLSGPRGSGKTALLRWLQRAIESSNPEFDVVWLTPNDIPRLDPLANALVPPSRFASMLPESLSLSVGVGRMGWKLEDQGRSLTSLLALRCARRPLVLLLDEAHVLAQDVGQTLLNTAQIVSAEAPFLLVMAGTPGLQPHLNTLSATFWSRAEKLGIGRLDHAATNSALTRPMAAEEPPLRFDADALERVIQECQGYPYFIQLWGAALWMAARSEGTARISNSLVDSAEIEFGRQRLAYYEDRREELERQELLPVAAHLATIFRNSAPLRSLELNTAIGEALATTSTPQVLDRRDRLSALGYVWKPPDAGDAWLPGIPSLMDYVAANAG